MAKLAHEFGNNDSQPPADHVFQSAVESADGETPTFTHIQASDWTLSSDYCFSLYPTNALKPVINVEQMIVHREILRAQTLLQSSSLSELVNKTQIEVASSSGIDFNMLRRRDLPILFYDELTLYEVRRDCCTSLLTDIDFASV